MSPIHTASGHGLDSESRLFREEHAKGDEDEDGEEDDEGGVVGFITSLLNGAFGGQDEGVDEGEDKDEGGNQEQVVLVAENNVKSTDIICRPPVLKSTT